MGLTIGKGNADPRSKALPWPSEGVPPPVLSLAKKEQFDFPTIGQAAQEAGRNDAAIVDDQTVAGSKQVGQISKEPVGQPITGPVEYEQP